MLVTKEIVDAHVSKVTGMGFFANYGRLDEIMVASREMNGFEFQLVKVATFNLWKDMFGNEIGVNVLMGLQIIVSKYIPKEQCFHVVKTLNRNIFNHLLDFGKKNPPFEVQECELYKFLFVQDPNYKLT
jgi:hypothetical protein